VHPVFDLVQKISHADSGVVGAGVARLDDHDTSKVAVLDAEPSAAVPALKA